MIWPTEALLLASTKLKTRKIRLIVTVVISSLLFGVLVFLASVTDGTIRSLQSFGEEGFGRKYLVQATPIIYQHSFELEQELKDKMGPVQRDLVARKKVAAKKLNVTYDEKSDQRLPLQIVQDGPSSTSEYPNPTSPFVQEYLNKKNASIPGASYQDFTTLAKAAGAQQVYRGTTAGISFSSGPPGNGGQVSVIIDGKEDIEASKGMPSGPPTAPTGVSSILTMGWRSADSALLQPFVLPGQTMVTGRDQSVPVIAPFSAAEEILGLKTLPQTATSEQKLARLVEVRRGVAGKTAQLCHRNGASQQLLSEAVAQQKEIEANKNKKDYTAPALIYQLPAAACGAVTVKTDKRTAEEKKEAANLKAFEAQFGQVEEPAQGMLAVRIIGITPDFKFDFSLSPAAILGSLFSSSLGAGWISPGKAIEASPLATTIQGGKVADGANSRSVYYAQFETLHQMEKFIRSQTCKGLQQSQGPDGSSFVYDASGGNFTDRCIGEKRVLNVTPFGNSAGAVEKFRSGIWKFARYAVLAIVVMAALVMMGNIGKIIADSRRETAVFRSLGAKRFDIAEIYLTYTILISLLVALCAVIVGSIAALVLSNKYSADLSLSAVLAYNAQDVEKTFTLLGFNPLYIIAICGAAILSGLLSAAIPLLTNTRRNPIRDMRDEA